jgi:septal ring factor EnvC (AmiA/AmiB activator)
MYFRAMIVCVFLAAGSVSAEDVPKDTMTRWKELNTKYRSMSRELMTRRSTIVKENEKAQVIQAQIRDLTQKIQDLQKELSALIEEDEEYKKLQTSVKDTQKELHAVTRRRVPNAGRVTRPVAPVDPSTKPAPGPLPPPPPPPPPAPAPK